jgi:hypothetical protein
MGIIVLFYTYILLFSLSLILTYTRNYFDIFILYFFFSRILCVMRRLFMGLNGIFLFSSLPSSNSFFPTTLLRIFFHSNNPFFFATHTLTLQHTKKFEASLNFHNHDQRRLKKDIRSRYK